MIKSFLIIGINLTIIILLTNQSINLYKMRLKNSTKCVIHSDIRSKLSK